MLFWNSKMKPLFRARVKVIGFRANLRIPVELFMWDLSLFSYYRPPYSLSHSTASLRAQICHQMLILLIHFFSFIPTYYVFCAVLLCQGGNSLFCSIPLSSNWILLRRYTNDATGALFFTHFGLRCDDHPFSWTRDLQYSLTYAVINTNWVFVAGLMPSPGNIIFPCGFTWILALVTTPRFSSPHLLQPHSQRVPHLYWVPAQL